MVRLLVMCNQVAVKHRNKQKRGYAILDLVGALFVGHMHLRELSGIYHLDRQICQELCLQGQNDND